MLGQEVKIQIAVLFQVHRIILLLLLRKFNYDQLLAYHAPKHTLYLNEKAWEKNVRSGYKVLHDCTYFRSTHVLMFFSPAGISSQQSGKPACNKRDLAWLPCNGN